MPESKHRPATKPDRAAVVTKAALRAASQLGMTNKVFANVVGLSDATVSRMLNDEPMALIQTVPGLMNVIQYLDARRAVV